MKLNKYVALAFTLFLDLVMLLIGGWIISSLHTGGSLIFFIECSIVVAIHRKVYRWLTGETEQVLSSGGNREGMTA